MSFLVTDEEASPAEQTATGSSSPDNGNIAKKPTRKRGENSGFVSYQQNPPPSPPRPPAPQNNNKQQQQNKNNKKHQQQQEKNTHSPKNK